MIPPPASACLRQARILKENNLFILFNVAAVFVTAARCENIASRREAQVVG